MEEAKRETDRLLSESADVKGRDVSSTTSTDQQQLVFELRRQLQIMERTVANTIAKNEAIEKTLGKEKQTIKDLACMFKVQESQTEKLKGDNIDLKNTNERLIRQLQAEKAENTGRLGWQQKESCRDRDDDEEIHRSSKTNDARSTTSKRGSSFATHSTDSTTPSTPTFKLPTSSAKILELKSLFAEEDAQFAAKNLTKQASSAHKKRKRSAQEEIDEKLPGLHLDDFVSPTGARKNKRIQIPHNDDEKFNFAAVRRYDATDTPLLMPSEDVEKCQFLQERITKTKEIWEYNKGADWLFEFTKTDYKPIIPPCLTMKLAGRRTRWRQNLGGRFACKDCVKNGRLCFTWVEREGEEPGEACSMWEFRLLPLHEEDRSRSTGKGKTGVNHWLNDDTCFQDGDVVKRDHGDEDYVD